MFQHLIDQNLERPWRKQAQRRADENERGRRQG
jgi:hypothetical protein